MRSQIFVLNCLSLSLLSLGWSNIAQAQAITSDGSLNTTIATPDSRNFTITNGNRAGNNLFHSFRDFSIPTGGSATFDLINTSNVSTIFSRVTGSNVSSIDGLIRTINHTTPVSLFLLNPNGILFGANAQLNLSGSFVAATANSIQFADGTQFNAVNPQSSALLTISVPVGLQFGQNPGTIVVQGTGHSLTAQHPLLSPYFPARLTTGLQVQPGQTLTLVGGNINLNGGTLSAPQGRIELGSVGAVSRVAIDLTTQGVSLGYEDVSSFGELQFQARSLVDVSGINAGSIQIQGRNIGISGSSVILSQNQGIQAGGDIRLQAAQLLEISGTTPDSMIPSGIVTETVGLGASGNLVISTAGLRLQDGAALGSKSFSPTSGGNVTITATDFVQMQGPGTINRSPSVIASVGFSSGQAGNVTLSTPKLLMLGNSAIAATTIGTGAGGEVVINTDSTDINGVTPNLSSGIFSTSYYGIGNAGSITINTRTLALRSGGTVSTSSAGVGGAAGRITINATDSVKVSGKLMGYNLASSITSAVGAMSSPEQRVANGLPAITFGNSGDIILNTPWLELKDGGTVSTQNWGSGNAGVLQIDATVVKLDNQADIVATALSGEGGNIFLRTQNLLLRRNSSIEVTAGGSGNGGNITLDAPILLGLENSDIVANAVQGRGGNIQITTQGIFGLKFRNLVNPRETSTNDITASSQSNVNGTVQITTPGVDPNSGLVGLPIDLSDPSAQIAADCAANQTSQFVITGRGGLPQSPLDQVVRDRPWSDIRNLLDVEKERSIAEGPNSLPPLLEATTWQRDAKGQVQLIAVQPAYASSSGNCATRPRKSTLSQF